MIEEERLRDIIKRARAELWRYCYEYPEDGENTLQYHGLADRILAEADYDDEL